MTAHATPRFTRAAGAKTLGALAVAGLLIGISGGSTVVTGAQTPGVLVMC